MRTFHQGGAMDGLMIVLIVGGACAVGLWYLCKISYLLWLAKKLGIAQRKFQTWRERNPSVCIPCNTGAKMLANACIKTFTAYMRAYHQTAGMQEHLEKLHSLRYTHTHPRSRKPRPAADPHTGLTQVRPAVFFGTCASEALA